MPGPSGGTTNSQHACNCGKVATRSKGGSLHHGHSHHHHQPHSTISSNIRKELASFENPYQSHSSVQGKKPTKRNASTESLDLFEKYHQEEDDCTCGLYSPRSFATERAKNCQKCSNSSGSSCTIGGKPRTAGMVGTAGHKKHNSSKFKDASTSPKSSSPLKTVKLDCRSPKTVDEKDSKFDFSCSPKTSNHYRRLSSLTINGANKQNAATSPMKHASALSTNEKVITSTPSPRMSPQKQSHTQNGGEQQRTLEKSNSLGDNKPPRLLRNTRSLSPRPPVRHQHSIMVSDENDIISVKLSPNQDFQEDGTNTREKTQEQLIDSRSNISAEVGSIANSEAGELKLDDCLKTASNNRSTSCLVYVPSDPWTKMSTNIPSPPPSVRQQKSKTLDNNCKAYGKPSLDYMKNCDPWVWRSNVQLTEGNGGGGKASKKRQHGLPHQTKSLTAGTSIAMSRDDCDIANDGKQRSAKLYQQQSLGRLEKTLNIPSVVEIGSSGSFDARKKITRPKLQRSKSPSFYEDFFQHPTQTGHDKNKSPQASGSHSLAKNKSASSLKMEKNASNSNLNGHGHNSQSSSNNHHNSNSGNSSTGSNNGSSGSSYGNYNGNGSPTTKKQPSPKFSILSSSSSSSKHQSPPRKLPTLCQPELTVKASQNLLNPNLLQPRHSFSTPSQKDDELQLNIRRLSEQMNNKYNHHSAAPAFLNDTIVQQQQQQHQNKKTATGSGSSLSASIGGGSTGGINEPPAAIQRKAASHSKINEPILETRC
uniref:Uncharacterized protein n=1 Tax=Anopheles darlingi TaxID=43151 RepID=A0A2M4CRI1_ANODA